MTPTKIPSRPPGLIPRSKEARAADFCQEVANRTRTNGGRMVGYLSMEYGLRPDLPIYSGGLGVLAGDTLKSCADLEKPVVAAGLLYRHGYFKQALENGGQVERPHTWSPERRNDLVDLNRIVEIQIGGQTARSRLWGYWVNGQGDGRVPLLLHDTFGVSNPPDIAESGLQLYKPGKWERLVQEMFLGIGSVRAFDQLGIPISPYHLNEGHGAFAVVEALRLLLNGKSFDEVTEQDLQQIRNLVCFTTHTPVPAGFDYFSWTDIKRAISETFLQQAVLALGNVPGLADSLPENQKLISMAHLAMRMSWFRNGVAKLHAEVSDQMFPEFAPIVPITNGVHHLTWTSTHSARIFDQWCPGWREKPTKLVELYSEVNNPDFRAVAQDTRQANKRRLLAFLHKLLGIDWQEDVLTIGFARRFATYKRAALIFSDEQRLIEIVNASPKGLQLIMAGKAHPADAQGKNLIRTVIAAGKRVSEATKGKFKFVFVPGYDMNIGALLTAGVDVWLNNPIKPREASGTSGMKANLNFGTNLSIPDGWWPEACGGGWSFGGEEPAGTDEVVCYRADSEALYKALQRVLGAYEKRAADPAFVTKMIEAATLNAGQFNTHRMVQQYWGLAWSVKPEDHLTLAAVKLRQPVSVERLGEILADTSFSLARATTERNIDQLTAEAVLSGLPNCVRATRYSARNDAVKRERRWTRALSERIFEERLATMGESAFDHWRILREFAGEVMADVLRSKKIQVIPDPKRDSRCCRNGSDPFILVPEIVDGEIAGIWKLDFEPGQLNFGAQSKGFLAALMPSVDKAKSLYRSALLQSRLENLCDEQSLINAVLTYMTAGGFTAMPPFSVATNRVAAFLTHGKKGLTGFQGIGDMSRAEFHSNLGRLETERHSAEIETFFLGLDQTGSRFNQYIKDKKLGPNIVVAPIRVCEGVPLFDSTRFPSDTTKMIAKLMGRLSQLFTVNGRTPKESLLVPITVPGTNNFGIVYADNAFTGEPLLDAKYIGLAQACAQRLAQIKSNR